MRNACPWSLVTLAPLFPAVMIALGSTLQAQRRPLSVDQLRVIFLSGGDVYGWDEYDVPEFVAAAYGARAKNAVIAILRDRSTEENYYLQLEALTTAQYPKLGVPLGLLLEYVEGGRTAQLPLTLRGLLRHRALASLSMMPEPFLVPFWQARLKEDDPSARQMAVRGLACALGDGAMPYLAPSLTDPDSSVKRVAVFYRQEFVSRGINARACGGRHTRAETLDAPTEIRPGLRRMADNILRKIP